MKKILAFTDIHMRVEGQTILGLDPFAQFQDALAHALANHADARHVMLMGDLTNSGKIPEYQRVRQVLQACPLPFTLMPGNHDNRDNMRAVFGDLPTTDQGYLQAVIDVEGDRLITLDTLDGPPFRHDVHSGNLCLDRLAWLERVLQRSSGKRVSVFTHHQPCTIGMDGIDLIRLRNGAEFIELLRRHPCVEHLFCGHLHRSVSGTMGGLGFTVFKGTCHQLPLVLGPGLDSMAVTEPAAYGLILLQEEAIVAHTEDWQFAIHDAAHQPEVQAEK